MLYSYLAKIIASRPFKITVFASQLYFTVVKFIMIYDTIINVVKSTVANFSHENLILVFCTFTCT